MTWDNNSSMHTKVNLKKTLFSFNTTTLSSYNSTFVYEQCVQQNLMYSTLTAKLLFERLTRGGLGSFWDRHMQLGDY